MHALHLVLLALGSVALGMPIFSLEARATQIRSLINLSPVVAPNLNLSQLLGCLGIGISACNPVHVNGAQNSDNDDGSPKSSSDDTGHDDENCTGSTSPSSEGQGNAPAENSGKGALINIAPVISPDISLSNPNSCVGVGVSVCNPINVSGDQDSDNDWDDDRK